MSKKTRTTEKMRNWTLDEVTLFAEVLTDDEFNFCQCLEKRALKKSANEDIFRSILEEFQKRLNEEFFIETNKKHFPSNTYNFLTVDIKKLQMKYNALKKQWRTITDRAKSGSGLAPDKTPDWYRILDPIFSDSNSGLEDIVSTPNETSFYQQNYESDLSNGDPDSANEEQFECDSEIPEKSKSKKLVVKPHQKRRVVRSQTQALSHLGAGLSQLAESHSKRQKLQMEFDKSRDEAFLKFKAEEAERNRKHELQMAAIFANCLSSTQHPRYSTPSGFPPTSPSAPMYPPMSPYLHPQRQNAYPASPTGNDTMPSSDESTYWRDSITKY